MHIRGNESVWFFDHIEDWEFDMMKTFATALAASFALTSAALAADDYEKFGDADGWTVWANTTTGGCFLENRENNGNVVQMGLVTNEDTKAFLGIWNHNDPLLQPGESVDLTLDVDGNPYSFTATANAGTVSEGLTGAYMYLNNPDFISDLENGQTLTIHISDDRKPTVDLTGTKKGIEMARECFVAQNS